MSINNALNTNPLRLSASVVKTIEIPKQSKKSSSQNETTPSLPGSSKPSICEQLMRIQQIACGPKFKGLGDLSQKSSLEPGLIMIKHFKKN